MGFKQLPRRAAQRQPHSTISRATSADEREQTKPQQEPRSRRQEHQTGNLHPAGEWVPPRYWLTRFFSSSRDVARERVPSPDMLSSYRMRFVSLHTEWRRRTASASTHPRVHTTTTTAAVNVGSNA